MPQPQHLLIPAPRRGNILDRPGDRPDGAEFDLFSLAGISKRKERSTRTSPPANRRRY
jgi:hypothetical protein